MLLLVTWSHRFWEPGGVSTSPGEAGSGGLPDKRDVKRTNKNLKQFFDVYVDVATVWPTVNDFRINPFTNHIKQFYVWPASNNFRVNPITPARLAARGPDSYLLFAQEEQIYLIWRPDRYDLDLARPPLRPLRALDLTHNNNPSLQYARYRRERTTETPRPAPAGDLMIKLQTYTS